MENDVNIGQVIDLVFDFEPADDLELAAFKAAIGGAETYHAIIIFKGMEDGRNRALEFFKKMQLLQSTISMMWGSRNG